MKDFDYYQNYINIFFKNLEIVSLLIYTFSLYYPFDRYSFHYTLYY